MSRCFRIFWHIDISGYSGPVMSSNLMNTSFVVLDLLLHFGTTVIVPYIEIPANSKSHPLYDLKTLYTLHLSWVTEYAWEIGCKVYFSTLFSMVYVSDWFSYFVINVHERRNHFLWSFSQNLARYYLLLLMLVKGNRGEKTQGKMSPSLVAFVPLCLCRACTCSVEHSI